MDWGTKGSTQHAFLMKTVPNIDHSQTVCFFVIYLLLRTWFIFHFPQQRWEAFLIFFTSLLSVSDSNCRHITSFPNIPGGEMSFPPKTKINTHKTSYHYSGARHINYLHFYLYCQFLPMIWLFVSKFKIILKFLPNQNQTFLWTISSPCITTVSVSSFFATCVLK